MKRAIQAGLAAGVLLLAGAQFVPPEYPRDNPRPSATIAGPPQVTTILRRACFDCHSYETRWPWYAYVAPLSWTVAADVAGGRSRLNFSEWEGLRDGFKRRHSRRIVERIEGREMPLPRYLWLHRSAAISADEVEVLRRWRDALASE